MMKENWIDQMRRKLEGHEVAPPEGLWEDICKEMGLTPERVRKTAASKRWYWAVAALLALAGFFAYYHEDGLRGKNEEPRVKNEELRIKSYDYSQDENKPKKGNYHSALPLGSAKNSSLSSKSPVLAAESRKDISADDQETEISQPPESASQPSEPSQDANVPISEPRSPISADAPAHSHSMATASGKPVSGKQGKWSVGLNALGGLLAATSVETYRLDGTQKNESLGFSHYDGLPNYIPTEYTWKHRLPWRLGLNVQYQLSNRLTLFSGISYTYLYSECDILLQKELHVEQKLHYLGIPLGISWQLWSSDHLRFYLSGSGMLEKCISSEYSGLPSQAVDGKKPWQWSVQAAAGAEYLFTPLFGAYLEPSLGYHFDDGTSLQHYYKEHQLAPSIEFGLRLHLKR